MNDQLALPKRIKVYFVELDDDDRERVLSGVLENVRITEEPEYDDIQIDALLDSAKIFRSRTRYKLEETYFVPGPDGTCLKLEDFSQMEGEEDEY